MFHFNLRMKLIPTNEKQQGDTTLKVNLTFKMKKFELLKKNQ